MSIRDFDTAAAAGTADAADNTHSNPPRVIHDATIKRSQQQSKQDEEKWTADPDPSPIRRLHRHALESILGFSAVGGLAAALRVSKEWNVAVRTMLSIRFTFPAPSAARLLPLLHSPLVRHLGVIDVRWEQSDWSVSRAIMAQLSARLAELSDLSCTADRLKAGPAVEPRLPSLNRVAVRLSLDESGRCPSMDQFDAILTALDQLACVVGLRPAARPWLSPLSAVRYLSHEWGEGRPNDRDDQEAEHAHALVTQLCVYGPMLESLSMDLLTSLDDLRTIGERLPQLHALHARLHSDELMQHLIVTTSAQRRAAVLEGLDAAGVISDLASLCAEYLPVDPASDARLSVVFLSQQLRDVGLLIREPEPNHAVLNGPSFLQLTTAVVRSLHALPQLTVLKLDLMPWHACYVGPRDSLAGFEWALLAEFSSLTSLSLHSTSSDPDYAAAIAWDEATAIAALRMLTQLTALDVSGFARLEPNDETTDDDEPAGLGVLRSMYAFDIASFARDPVAHASLRDLRVTCEWGRGVVWSADQCAAFRRLPLLQWIDGEPIDSALDTAAKTSAWRAERGY